MSIFSAPLTNADGKVRVYSAPSGQVPAGAVQFRGLWVTPNNLVCVTPDTGQDRTYYGGLAFEKSSGLLLYKDTGVVPTVPMDGMNVDQTGALEYKTGGVVDVIHQGVGLAISSPGGVIQGDDSDPPVTFLAPLEYGVAATGGLTGTPSRNSTATYWAQDGTLRLAQVNEIRQEFLNGEPLGTLMEPASTNKCENYNANPDAALSNMAVNGDPAAILSRVLDREALYQAGLSFRAESGYVFRLDNRAGSTTARVTVEGQTGNTNAHAVSVWWRGSGLAQIGVTGAYAPSEALPDHYVQESATVLPSAGTNIFAIQAAGGSDVFFVLNQLEESEVPSSVIVTEGAAASRAVDQLSWSLAGNPYGPDDIVNGQFDSDSDWTLEPGWTISDGKARYDGTNDANRIFQATLTVGEFYRLEFECEMFDPGGCLQARNGPSTNIGPCVTESGRYSFIFKATADTTIRFVAGLITTRFRGTLDNVQCHRLTPIFNQTEGMAAFVWTPSTSKDAWVSGSRAILSIDLATLNLMFLNNDVGVFELRSTDGTVSAIVAFPGNDVSPGVDYVLALRWGNGNFQVGIKTAGAWIWGATPAYDGDFPIDDRLHLLSTKDAPSHARHLALWSADAGTAWLENFFSGVAN